MLDPSVGVYRIHGKALKDGIVGWVTVAGNQGTAGFGRMLRGGWAPNVGMCRRGPAKWVVPSGFPFEPTPKRVASQNAPDRTTPRNEALSRGAGAGSLGLSRDPGTRDPAGNSGPGVGVWFFSEPIRRRRELLGPRPHWL